MSDKPANEKAPQVVQSAQEAEVAPPTKPEENKPSKVAESAEVPQTNALADAPSSVAGESSENPSVHPNKEGTSNQRPSDKPKPGLRISTPNTKSSKADTPKSTTAVSAASKQLKAPSSEKTNSPKIQQTKTPSKPAHTPKTPSRLESPKVSVSSPDVKMPQSSKMRSLSAQPGRPVSTVLQSKSTPPSKSSGKKETPQKRTVTPEYRSTRNIHFPIGIQKDFSLSIHEYSKLGLRSDPTILQLIHNVIGEILQNVVIHAEDCREYRNQLYQLQRKPVEKMFVTSTLSFQHTLETNQTYISMAQLPDLGQVVLPVENNIYVYGSHPLRHVGTLFPRYPKPEPLILPIHSIAVDPNGYRIYALHVNGVVRVWDVVRRLFEAEFQIFPTSKASSAPNLGLVMVHDSCLMVNLTWMDGFIYVYEPLIGRLIRRFALQAPPVPSKEDELIYVHELKFVGSSDLFLVSWKGLPNIYIHHYSDGSLRAILMADIGLTPCFTYSEAMQSVIAGPNHRTREKASEYPRKQKIVFWNIGLSFDFIAWNQSVSEVKEEGCNIINEDILSMTFLEKTNLLITCSDEGWIRFYEQSEFNNARKKELIISAPKFYKELYPMNEEIDHTEEAFLCAVSMKSDFAFEILDKMTISSNQVETLIGFTGDPFNLTGWMVGKATVPAPRHDFNHPVSWREYIDEKRPLLHEWGKHQTEFYSSIPRKLKALEEKFDKFDKIQEQIIYELESYYTRAGISAIPQKEVHLNKAYQLSLEFPRRGLLTGKNQPQLTTDEIYSILSEVKAMDRSVVSFLKMCITKPLDVCTAHTDPFNLYTAELIPKANIDEWTQEHVKEFSTVFVDKDMFIEIVNRMEFYTRLAQSIETMKRSVTLTAFARPIKGIQRIIINANFVALRKEIDVIASMIKYLRNHVYRFITINRSGKKVQLNININRSLECSEDMLEFDDVERIGSDKLKIDVEISMLYDGQRRSYAANVSEDGSHQILTIAPGSMMEEELENGYSYLHHFRRELYLLRSLGRPYFMNFTGAAPESTPPSASTKASTYNIRMVFNEDLEDYVPLSQFIEMHGRFSFGDRYYIVRYWASHILQALNRFHFLGGILRGIRTDRILISPDGKDICFSSIRDFAYTDDEGYIHSTRLSFGVDDPYAPPESYFSTKFISPSFDTWMFGCLIFELMFGQKPKPCFTPEERTRYHYNFSEITTLKDIKLVYDPFEGWQNTKVVSKADASVGDESIQSKTTLVCYPSPDPELDGIQSTEDQFEYLMDFIVKEGSSLSMQSVIRKCMVVNPEDRIKIHDLLKMSQFTLSAEIESIATNAIEAMMSSFNIYRNMDKIFGHYFRQLIERWLQEKEFCYVSAISIIKRICDTMETPPLSSTNEMHEYTMEERAVMIELLFEYRVIDTLIIISMRRFKNKEPGSESCMDAILNMLEFFAFELSKSHGAYKDLLPDILGFFLRVLIGEEGDFTIPSTRYVVEPIILEITHHFEWMQIFNIFVGKSKTSNRQNYWLDIGGPNWTLFVHNRVLPMYQRILGEDSLGSTEYRILREFMESGAFTLVDQSCLRTKEYFKELRMLCENIPRVFKQLKLSTKTTIHNALHYFYNVLRKGTPDVNQLFVDLRLIQKILPYLSVDDEAILSEVLKILLEISSQAQSYPWSFSIDFMVSCFEQPTFINLIVEVIMRNSCPDPCRLMAIHLLSAILELSDEISRVIMDVEVFARLIHLLPSVYHWSEIDRKPSKGKLKPTEYALMTLFAKFANPQSIFIESYIRTNASLSSSIQSKRIPVVHLLSLDSLGSHNDNILALFSGPKPSLVEHEFVLIEKFIRELRLVLMSSDYIENLHGCELSETSVINDSAMITSKLLLYLWNKLQELGVTTIENKYEVERCSLVMKQLISVVECFVDGSFPFIPSFAEDGIICAMMDQFGHKSAYQGASSQYTETARRFRMLVVRIINSHEPPVRGLLKKYPWHRIFFEDLKREHDYLRRTKLGRDENILEQFNNRAMSRAQLLSYIVEKGPRDWLQGLTANDFYHYVIVDGMGDTTVFDPLICSQFPAGKFGRYLIRNDCYMIYKYIHQRRKESKECMAWHEGLLSKIKEYRVWHREVDALRRWQDDRHYAIVSVCLISDMLETRDPVCLSMILGSDVVDIITSMYFDLRLWYQNVDVGDAATSASWSHPRILLEKSQKFVDHIWYGNYIAGRYQVDLLKEVSSSPRAQEVSGRLKSARRSRLLSQTPIFGDYILKSPTL